MKKILFVIVIGISACTTGSKQPKLLTDTSSKINNANSSKIDTGVKALVKEKSLEQQADERLDRIMKKRKYVK